MRALELMAARYLKNKSYHIRSNDIPEPKVGDKIVFRNGGAWAHNSYYEISATVAEIRKDHFGYIFYWVNRKDKSGILKHAGAVHPFEVFGVKKS